MKEELRVHIVPIGYDSYTRVTEPLIKKNAEKVYFIRHKEDGRGHEKFYEKIKKELDRKTKKIIIKERKLDIWDYYDCVETFREIISNEKKNGNHIYINVSTGTKITAMAGMLAAMAWRIEPYYVRLTKPLLKKIETVPEVAVDDPEEIHAYDMEKPKPVYMDILDQLSKHKGVMRKKRLVEYLEDKKIIKPVDDDSEGFSQNAKLSQLRVFLDPMKDKWNFVKTEHSGRRSEVMITENGRKALRIFGIEDLG